MITKIKFGECLHLLLSALDISNNRLSKAINVDSSLISRWMHEKRIPLYHSNYIENIASFLSQNVLNSFQEQHLNEAINIISVNIDKTLDTKDRIMKALLQSQGCSLESKKAALGKKNSDLKSIQRINLSKENNIIIGRKNIISAMLSLIEIAIKEKCINNNVIYMSCNSNINVTNFYDDFICLRDVVLKALRNGYTVRFLFKLTRNLTATINFIKFLQPLIETGHLLLYYYKAYDTFDFGRESTIIPNIGALSILSTTPSFGIDSAFYIENQVGIDILSNNFNAILFNSSKSLVKYYTLDESLEYIDSLDESEKRAGNQFLFKDTLSLLTIPSILFKKLLEKLPFTNNQLIKELELHNCRLNTFLSNLQYYEYFNIYTLNSIQKIIKNKQLSFNFPICINTIDLEIEDIIVIIQNIINLIITYDNYKFALINELFYKNENNITSFIIKEKHRVYIEYSNLAVSIKEPMIVYSLEEHFRESWEHISPVDKNKKDIVKWLEHQIDVLKKQLV